MILNRINIILNVIGVRFVCIRVMDEIVRSVLIIIVFVI